MRKQIIPALLGFLLVAALSLVGGTATAGPPRAPAVVGHVYVNDNTAGSNTVAAFDRHADGSLTPIPGSPFPIGGAGLGAGLGSQGAIQVSPSGRFLLAVDAGSNQISVLRLNHRGIPELVGAPVSSGGVQPVSIAINRTGLVYVANVGQRRQQLHRVPPHPSRPADPTAAHARSRSPRDRASVMCCSTRPATGSSAPGTTRR